MKSFNWRVMSPNTLRSYERAARDFETVTGRRIQDADEVSISAFRASMEGRGLSIGTIQVRLSAVSVISGVKVELPRRPKTEEPTTLSAEQVRVLMSNVTDYQDRIALVQALTLGELCTKDAVSPETFSAHFAGQIPENTYTSRDITRRLKKYARKSGLNERQISFRVWCLTGRKLMNTLGAADLVNTIGNTEAADGIQWKPLHGIGRRSQAWKL